MIVEFSCLQCGKAMEASAEYAGKRIRCRTCKAVLVVPGRPPVHDRADNPRMPRPPAREMPDAESNEAAGPGALPDDALSAEPTPNPESHGSDNSYGIASLYLATLSFLLFCTPAILAGLTGPLGVSVAFFAGLVINAGCFQLCRHGQRLALKAEETGHGPGYAAAGKIVNAFLLKLYVLAIGFFLVGGILTLLYARHSINQLQDQFKGLEKLLGP